MASGVVRGRRPHYVSVDMLDDLWQVSARCLKQEVIERQRPGKTKGFRLADDLTQPFNEIIAILIICEYTPALDSAHDYVIQGAESIRALRQAILHRKNALFYNTQRGAQVGDLLMSLNHTCQLAGINPSAYPTRPLKNTQQILKSPHDFFPWKYQPT